MAEGTLPWRAKAYRLVLETPWVRVSETDYVLPDGGERIGFCVVAERDGVVVVPLTPENRVVLVRQYRAPVEEVVYEFPGGLLEAGDQSPLQRAQLELQEETGYAAAEWHDLGTVLPAPHRLAKRQHGFLALGSRAVSQPSPDEGELLGHEVVSLPALAEMVRNGEFRCGGCLSVLAQILLVRPNLLVEASQAS